MQSGGSIAVNASDRIESRLHQIEREEQIEILYACESGSRAWGFASPDSDYDVRFVYKRSLKHYLSLQETKDTLEYPISDNLDFSGWDLKKFLLHFGKSNGVMFEWLQSPIVYLDVKEFGVLHRQLMPKYFHLRSTAKHYLGLAKRTFLDFREEPKVKLKKYFYILRPLFAAHWICQKQSIPPMEFGPLFKAADLGEKSHSNVIQLQKIKNELDESAMITRIRDLESFIAEELERCEKQSSEFPETKIDLSELDRQFMESVITG
jgi:hypothetical protein